MFVYVMGGSVGSGFLLPLGISYFCLKLIHYIIESGRGSFKIHSPAQYFTYLFLFPVFTAGPIERFDHFQRNWTSQSRRTDFVEGSTRIIYGLIKKFVISGVLLAGMLKGNSPESILYKIELFSASCCADWMSIFSS